MTNAFTMGLRSVAQRERKINHPELGGILDGAADEIDRLNAALDLARIALLNIERKSEEGRAALTRALGR